MNLGLTGKTALISGGDSGIGLATARILVEEGARVVLTDIDQGRLEEALATLGADEGKAYAFAADLTSSDDIDGLVRRVSDEVGAVDILVHSAGITGATGLFHEIDERGWQETLDVNLMAPVRLTRAFLPSMRGRGWGRIVFIASEDAVQTYPDEIPYCAAKAGLLALSKGLSRTYAQEGILVNAVSPAFIATPMTDAMMQQRADELGVTFDEAIESFLEEERPGIELKRRGEASEVAPVIAMLCSELASFVNGANWRVDGGSVATM
jgi:NAD(P)-dependent dehydrogenase (short-subunit alcohol dehydrogenase family)